MTMGTITKDFSYHEFERSAKADELGIRNVINTFAIRDAVKALAETVLQPLRCAREKPLTINSGYRCPELNKNIKGSSPTSQHVKGEAADILTGSEEESYRLASLAKELGLPYDQMILYPTFVHFSHKLDGRQRGQILYNKSYKGQRL